MTVVCCVESLWLELVDLMLDLEVDSNSRYFRCLSRSSMLAGFRSSLSFSGCEVSFFGVDGHSVVAGDVVVYDDHFGGLILVVR